MLNEIKSFFITDPDLANSIVQIGQWVITGLVALGMICFRLHKNKIMGPGWSLEHCDSSYWKLTRLHDKVAKVLFLEIHHESLKILTPSGATPEPFRKNDSVILEIPAYHAGSLYVFFVSGRKKVRKHASSFPSADYRIAPEIEKWKGTYWVTDKNDESYKS